MASSSSGSFGVHWADQLERVGGPLTAPRHHGALPSKPVLKKCSGDPASGGLGDLPAGCFAAAVSGASLLQPAQAPPQNAQAPRVPTAQCGSGVSHIGRKRSRLNAYGD